MNEKILAWIHGKYVSPIEGVQHGANVRSSYLINIISSIVGSPLIIDIGITRSRHFSVRSDRLFIGLPLSKSSLLLRGINKLLERLKIISQKSAFTVVSVGVDYSEARKLLHYPIDLLVVDGPLGITVSDKLVEEIKLRYGSKVIYVSHDFLIDRYSGFWLRKLLDAEYNIVQHADLIISASRRDEMKYKELYGVSDRILTFPNIFPLPNHTEFISNIRKRDKPTLVVIGGKFLANNIEYARLLKKLYDSLNILNLNIVYIGKHPPRLPKSRSVEYYEYIPSRVEFFRTLGRAHIGLNYALLRGGSNVKRYDYSLAGLVVLDNPLGARGEWLPHEYTFIDEHDFVVKLSELISLGSTELSKLGQLNLLKTCELYDNCYKKLATKLNTLE